MLPDILRRSRQVRLQIDDGETATEAFDFSQHAGLAVEVESDLSAVGLTIETQSGIDSSWHEVAELAGGVLRRVPDAEDLASLFPCRLLRLTVDAPVTGDQSLVVFMKS
jgi:hypothetical protein